MSVAVCRTSFADILMPSAGASSSSMAWLLPPRQEDTNSDHPPSLQHDQKVDQDDSRPGQFDIWASIQAKKAEEPAAETAAPPYVHPLLCRSSSSLSQKSLEICTESLGSETGSDTFSSTNEMDSIAFFSNKDDEGDEERHHIEVYEDEKGGGEVMKELTTVNYQCSVGRRSSPARKFPPPLPSISRRDGVPCLSMRPHRRDGRLVVEAVAVPSQNYLHADRQGGRLLLSFINAAASAADIPQPVQEQLEQQDVESTDHEELREDEVLVEEEEEEEEVEVVERGTVVEVKVSGGPAAKVLRSTLVINKFVGATPVGNQERWTESEQQHQHQNEQQAANNYNTNETKVVCEEQQRRATSSASPPGRIPTTAAAATVAETALSAMGSGDVRDYGRLPRLAAQHAVSPDTKVLFTSKRRNREELLHNMRRCSQLRRPLFVWETYCIATS